MTPSEITPDILVTWFGHQRWKPETRKGYRCAIHAFFAWMALTGRIDRDPSESLPKIRRPHAHPHPCPDKVIITALCHANNDEMIMLRLGAECGLRRAEIAQVCSRDVMEDLLGKTLVVIGKGDKQRIVPIPDDLADMIEQKHGYVFPGRWTGHVEASYVGRHVRVLLGDGWSTHSLRHRYATATYMATHDLYLVSKLLGHESVETTQRYVALPDSRLREAMSCVKLLVT